MCRLQRALAALLAAALILQLPATAAAAPDARQQADALVARAETLLQANRLGDAETALGEALAIAGRMADRPREAAILQKLGAVAFYRGDFSRAAAHYERAVALLRQLGDPMAEAWAAILLAEVYMAADASANVDAALAQAQDAARRGGFRLPPELLEMIRAEQQGNRQEARDATRKFLALPWVKQMTAGTPFDLNQMAEPPARGDAGKSPPGPEANAPPPAPLEGIPPGVLAWAGEGLRGMRAYQESDMSTARAIFTRLLAASRRIGQNDFSAFAAAFLGAIAEQEGQKERSIELFDQAVAAVEDEAGALGNDQFLTIYEGSKRNLLYSILVELLLRRGKEREAFEVTERARARALLQLLGNRRLRLPRGEAATLGKEAEDMRRAIAADELAAASSEEPESGPVLAKLRRDRTSYEALHVRMEVLDPEYASLMRVEPLRIGEVQRALAPDTPGAPGTTLVSYFVGLTGVQAWVIDETQWHHVALQVDRAALKAATCFADAVSRHTGGTERGSARLDGCEAPATLAERLHDQLIAPLLPYVRHRRLVIVPHGELHYVPFAALRNGHTGRRLVEDFAIAYAPSASVLRLLRAKEHPIAGRALVLGAPAVAGRGLAPLKYMAEEARAVAGLFGTSPLLGAAARESAVFDLAGHFDLVHVAAHGIYDPSSPLWSRIALAPDGRRNGNLEVQEIFSDLDLRGVSLVVLSACQSALGERSGGDEIVGLTRSLLYAGTPAVVSTLWSVDDRASEELMVDFYRRLLAGARAAEALQQAQIDLLGRPETADPYFWAGFTLTGDPQQRWSAARAARP